MNAMVEVSLNSKLNCALWNVLKLNNDKGCRIHVQKGHGLKFWPTKGIISM